MRSGHRCVERIFGLQCFHVVCFHYGGTEAGRRRVSMAGPQEWVLEPFFRCVLRSGSGLRQLVLRLLKYRSRDIDAKILRLLWNRTGDSAVVLLIRLSNFKAIGESYQSPGFDISRNLRMRHLNSLLNGAPTGRVVMLMKTKWELCLDMTIICLHYYEGRCFQYRKTGYQKHVLFLWFCTLD